MANSFWDNFPNKTTPVEVDFTATASPMKHCSTCGSALKNKPFPAGFNAITGEKVIHDGMFCARGTQHRWIPWRWRMALGKWLCTTDVKYYVSDSNGYHSTIYY